MFSRLCKCNENTCSLFSETRYKINTRIYFSVLNVSSGRFYVIFQTKLLSQFINKGSDIVFVHILET